MREDLDSTYWLRRCHGFRVEGREGRIGTVVDILYGAEHDRPSALLLRTGLLRQRLEIVSTEDVERVDPRLERIQLRGDARDR